MNRNKGVKLKQQKINYDRTIKPFIYEEGDLILKDKPSRTQNGQFRKLGKKFDGPYKIIRILSPLVYKIKHVRPGSKSMNSHHNRLKKYYGSIPETSNTHDKQSESDDDLAAGNNVREIESKTKKSTEKPVKAKSGRPQKLYCICRQPNYGLMLQATTPIANSRTSGITLDA